MISSVDSSERVGLLENNTGGSVTHFSAAMVYQFLMRPPRKIQPSKISKST